MDSNPVNLALRFLLELAALYSIGYWGRGGNRGVINGEVSDA